MKKLLTIVAVALTIFTLTPAHAEVSYLAALAHAGNNITAKAPITAQIEVGFSPDEGAENLVLKAIVAARSEIRVLSYSFTSAQITHALLAAKHRGVDVAMIVDYKNNLSEDRSGKAKHALNALAHAGVRIRTISNYPIHHDKALIVDGQHVETGSFNFSDAAAHRNSENVIVLWNHPVLAQIYLRHWENRFSRGRDYLPG
jgi:phosphatidylserine/phosphatidylglycerophosphate/cardiolipin synthase-like enzyme